jgi:undecaprenyl-diphosphatase
MLWALGLFAATFALGFAAKANPLLRCDGFDIEVNRVNAPMLDHTALLLDQLDHVAVVASILSVTFIAVLLVKRWQQALGTVMVIGLGWLTTIVVKLIVAQARPDLMDAIHGPHATLATLSYPSGHVVFATALVTALAMILRGWRAKVGLPFGILFVLVVAWSRLYVGAHYWTDAVGGILNGVAGVLLIAGVWNSSASAWRRRIRSRPASSRGRS